MARKISDVAKALNLSVDTLRYYEKIGLLKHVKRSEGGICQYTDNVVVQLQFICHAKRMGFDLESIRELLKFRLHPSNSKPQVRSMVKSKITKLDQRIKDLSLLRDELQILTQSCESSVDPECPILKDFEK